MNDSVIGKTLARLTRLKTDDHRIVTCYLKLELSDRSRGKYLIKLKNRVKQVESALPSLGLSRAVRDEVVEDLGRVLESLREPARLPSSHGVAIFACRPLKLFETVPLPRVHRSRLGVDRTPLVRELASVEDEFGSLLTAVVDRMSARFYLVTAFGAEELDRLRANNSRGGRFHPDSGAPGVGEHTWHNRIRNERQRHSEMVAQRLFDLHRKHPVHGVVLAGRAEARAIEPFLHPYLAERLMGTVQLDPKEASLSVVHGATLAVREAFERASEREASHELKEGIGTGWAVNGIEQTLPALSKGQVRTILVDAEAGGPGFRGSVSGRLVPDPAGLIRGEGEAVPVLDLVDEAIEDALRQRVKVEVIYDAEARGALDGLAGLLRFR
jgi:peptide chain release factor subunit 1